MHENGDVSYHKEQTPDDKCLIIKMSVFSHSDENVGLLCVTPCRTVGRHRSFEGILRLHLQRLKIPEAGGIKFL
jgi:hypothetical protein